MNNLMQYSNGWGHLIMSITTEAIAVFLLLQPDPTLHGVAIGMITAVQSSWFITAAKRTNNGGNYAQSSGGTP